MIEQLPSDVENVIRALSEGRGWNEPKLTGRPEIKLHVDGPWWQLKVAMPHGAEALIEAVRGWGFPGAEADAGAYGLIWARPAKPEEIV